MTNTMMIIGASWYDKPAFKMIPMDKDCPFNEVIFDPERKILAIISKDQKVKPQMLPKVDDDGNMVSKKKAKPEDVPYKEERRMMEAYYEYYIESVEDMKYFIAKHAINPEHPASKLLD
jgi:hypothetical protein